MTAAEPYIIYALPQSRVTQALTGKKIEKVWSNIQRFLANCTTADIAAPESISMVVYTADEDYDELPEPAEQILAETKQIFGAGNTEPVSYSYPENIPSKQTRTEWRLDAKDLKTVIDYLIACQPFPKYNFGPVDLILSYNFRLTDPAAKTELAGQQYDSSILIWLTRNSCISATLCFPFTEPSEEFWDYANSITEFIPFKFDNKFLRKVRLNKKGTANVFSKL